MGYIELPILETERLILRPIGLQDAQDMFEYAKNPLVGPRAGWPPHQDISETKIIIERMENSLMTDTTIGIYAIIWKATQKMIGTIGMQKYNNRYAYCELGYVLNPDFWGKGVMVEGVHRVMDFLFHDFGLYRIECGHYDFNQQSKRVIEKLGFKLEGINRKKIVLWDGSRCDLYNYAILKEEYQN